MVFFAVDEESEHDELEEVVEPVGVLGNEGNVLGLLDFAPDDCGRALDDRVFFELLLFFVQLVRYLLLGLLHLFQESLDLSAALLLCALDLALGRFDPAQRDGQVYAHENVLPFVQEGNDVCNVFLVADFMVLCVLVEGRFVLADHWLVLVLSLIHCAPDEWELEIAAGRKADTHQY